jgi:pectinacetylesterase
MPLDSGAADAGALDLGASASDASASDAIGGEASDSGSRDPDAATMAPEDSGVLGAPDAEPAACTQGAPIGGLADEQWTWVPFPRAECGGGSPTGLEINLTRRSSKVLLFMNGGGACYDAESCSPTCNAQFQLCAMNLGGFQDADFRQFLATVQPGTIFDRASAANPFREFTWVFIPYCTGDFHIGNAISSYGIHHVGYANVTAYLDRLAPTFCHAERIVLAGASAGGFGAVFNYDQVKTAFGSIHVDLIDDSGPLMSESEMPLQTTMMTAWNGAPQIPAGCPACANGWEGWYPYVAAAHPEARISLLSSLHDFSIGPAFGGPIAQPDGFANAIHDLADRVLIPLPNARVFFVDEFNHVELKERLDTKVSLGVTLGEFLTWQVTDDPQWQNVRP